MTKNNVDILATMYLTIIFKIIFSLATESLDRYQLLLKVNTAATKLTLGNNNELYNVITGGRLRFFDFLGHRNRVERD